MIEYEIIKEEKKIPKTITCDICKKTYIYENDIMEVQEFVHIYNDCGFSSIFGDGAEIFLDICQYCLREKLGKYLIIKE